MNWKVIAAALAVVLLAVALILLPSPPRGPEPIVYGRDACARCRMSISGPGFGGELRDKRGTLTRYDDVGCLLIAMWALHDEVPGAWVEDHGGAATAPMVPLLSAKLVRDSRLVTPMGHGVIAFASDEEARQFMAAQGGSRVTLEELLRDKARFSRTGPAPLAATPGGKRPLTEADARDGKALYLRECSACHGERGGGDGPAAAFLDPRPRDFTKKQFRLRTTPSGEMPATEDLLRTVERGLPGSAMPAFAFLTVEERRKIVAHVMNLADILDSPEPARVEDPGTPPPVTAASIARGKTLYEETLQCFQCHGKSGRGDGPAAAALKDDAGATIPVRDFTGGAFRGGAERVDLWYRFVTGMDGTPMPAFRDSAQGDDRWALVDYVQSLRATPPPVTLPADPLLAGRAVAARYSCRGCHVLDDGKGGDVGPDLRIAGQKLSPAWVRTWLRDPRGYGHVYPWRVHRMPKLEMSAEEVEVMARYIAALGKRKDEPLQLPDPASFPQAKLDEGKNLFVLRCTECHTLGKVIETPLIKQQGPDLIRVVDRVDYQWARKWISDPKAIDPRTKMTVPTGITAEQVDSVRMFVWKSSIDARATAAPTPTAARP